MVHYDIVAAITAKVSIGERKGCDERNDVTRFQERGCNRDRSFLITGASSSGR